MSVHKVQTFSFQSVRVRVSELNELYPVIRNKFIKRFFFRKRQLNDDDEVVPLKQERSLYLDSEFLSSVVVRSRNKKLCC